VHHNVEPGVQSVEQRTRDRLLARLNWDDLNLLRSISKSGSVRKAAIFASVSPNTIRARLERLENRAGVLLFARSSHGLTATDSGKLAIEIANAMGQLGDGFPFGPGNQALVRSGELRLRVTEGLGSIWLTPRLGSLHERLSEIRLVFDCDFDQDQQGHDDYDLCVGFAKPRRADAIVSRIATLHVMPFASRDYLARNGIPGSIDDLKDHRIIHQAVSGVEHDAIRLFIDSDLVERLVSLQVSSSYALFGAIASGLGIGAMPTYVSAVYGGICPVDLPIRLRFPVWASYRAAASDTRPIRAAMAWLRQCFDASLHPWFGEQFIHPREFGGEGGKQQIAPASDRMIDAIA
jgi:DNA-binding transcriptional LysR family regulator